MSTDLVVHDGPSLAEQMQFARAVTEGGRALSILPDAYKENPANVLIAVGLGASMGLSPAESLYRISVIKGKPTAGAELIAANVRKAGHRLRVRGDETTCTATIVRADDPDYEFSVTRDLAWAQRMGLASNDNYRKQAGTMLQWRAITAVARLACPEALYGVTYTPDEMLDSEAGRGQQQQAPEGRTAGVSRLRAAVPTSAPKSEQVEVTLTAVPDPVADVSDSAEVVDEPPTVPAITKAQSAKMYALLKAVGLGEKADALRVLAEIIGHEVASTKDLTKDEASRVIDELGSMVAPVDDEADSGWPEVAQPGGAR